MQNGDAQRQGLEVEEDFDLVKLGFIPDRSEAKSLEKIGDHHVDSEPVARERMAAKVRV